MRRIDGNPGQTTGGQVAFANGERSWSESFDVLEALQASLGRYKHDAVRREGEILLPAVDILLLPRLVDGIQPLDEGGVRTVTTVEIYHPRLFRRGVFEYQHATGNDVQASLGEGFDNWVQLDLVPILDALRSEPENCSSILMPFPATDTAPPIERRAVLGPVAFYKQDDESEDGARAEGHESFCPCCLLSHSYQAFEDLIREDETFAIRFYAARDGSASPAADCRVNGFDHERGMGALRQYVLTWPGHGIQFRKQYVIVHTR